MPISFAGFTGVRVSGARFRRDLEGGSVSNPRLTVWIDGQEVLPVRALPYITTSSRFRPEVLARRFAGSDPFGRTWTLNAYHYIHEDFSVCVPPYKWEEVVSRHERFQVELKEQFLTGTVGNTLWSIGAVAVLPACWYVLPDDFEKAFHADMGLKFDRRLPADHDLNFSPVIDASTRAMVTGCFENLTGKETTLTPLDQPLMQIWERTETETSPPIQQTGIQRITKDRAFLLDLEREGIPMSIEPVWLHIYNNAGKDNFLFKSVSKDTATTRDDKQVKKENLERVLLDLVKSRKTRK
jgi:hypothetical protein